MTSGGWRSPFRHISLNPHFVRYQYVHFVFNVRDSHGNNEHNPEEYTERLFAECSNCLKKRKCKYAIAILEIQHICMIAWKSNRQLREMQQKHAHKLKSHHVFFRAGEIHLSRPSIMGILLAGFCFPGYRMTKDRHRKSLI